MSSTEFAAGDVPAPAGDYPASTYATVVGPNADYYLPKFQAFDAGESRLSWNWPAFLITSAWFIYRRMYVAGALCLVPVQLLIIGLSTAAGAWINPAVGGWVGLGLFILYSVLGGVFANQLYWKQVRTFIAEAPRNLPAEALARDLAKRGGTSILGLLGLSLAVSIPMIGVLAAIAIPAYHDYTIRAQVYEGLNLAADPKAAVAEFYAANGAWPETGADAGWEDPQTGLYVGSIGIEKGSIVIVYGGSANAAIAEKTLILVPGIDESGDIVWVCGNLEPEGIREYGPGPYGTDLDNKYLPATCRSPAEGAQ